MRKGYEMGGLQAALEQWLAEMPADEWAALKARVRGPEDASAPPNYLRRLGVLHGNEVHCRARPEPLAAADTTR
jgi:hypothetical protein